MLPQVKARYYAKAIAAWLIEVESSGNYQIAVQCEVTDGEHRGERIAWTGTFAAGKAMEIAIKALQRGFGWKGDDLNELADIGEEDCSRILPNVVEIVCDMDDYNGDRKLKVQWVNEPGGGRFGTPLVGAKLSAFAAQMRGTIRGAAGVQRSAPTKAPAQQQVRHLNAPAGIDEDIPF